jgi:hypothetical protein
MPRVAALTGERDLSGAADSAKGQTMDINHSNGRAVRTAALALGAIFLALTAACTTTTQGLAVPEKFSAETTLSGASDTVGDQGACTHVDAPMLDIPTATDGEPRMRIPTPAGWEPTDELNDVDAGIRFGLVSTGLIADEARRNVVVVTLEAVPDVDAQTIFDKTRTDLVDVLAEHNVPTDLTTTSGTVCGLPAETITYAGDAAHDAFPVTILSVVAKAGGDTYQAAVVQTIHPANSTYERDAETILTGFEVLPPTAQQL